jgi:2-polyprenyl-6-methoxyphenol hydroxylase-like FAD-dependent oxidoreductase
MTKKTSRALIVGGGVGGTTAAIALRRVGIEPLVFERMSGPVVGTGLHLASNALRALQYVELGERIAAAGTPVERSQFLTSRGDPLADWPMGDLGRKLGAPAVGITRPELVRILRETLGPDALRLDAECTGFAQDGSGVTARLADGTEERGDILVGADGLNSVIRAQLMGAADPRFRGSQNSRAVIEFDDDLAPPGVFRQYWGNGSVFMCYRVSQGRLYWVAATRAPRRDGASSGGRKAALLASYRDYVAPVPAVIEATEEDAIVQSPGVDRDPLKRWGEGRVTLLGDAAHPMMPTQGQGACQALEDAVVLARRLDEQEDTVAALRAYEARRIERTTSVVRQSRLIGALGLWENPAACALRNSVLRLLFNRRAMGRLEKLLAFEP